MEDYSSSSSSASYLSHNMQETKVVKQGLPYYSSIHSVRKAPAKPWKKPIAPLPPTPPRVYKVDPVNFRELVQKLTAAPEYVQGRRLQSVAPPPLDVVAAAHPAALVDERTAAATVVLRPLPAKPSLSTMYREFSDTLEMKYQKGSDAFLGLNLSPSSYSWCSNIPLLSPGTLSSLEHSTVL